jgi:SAM-dependent methyltransferase
VPDRPSHRYWDTVAEQDDALPAGWRRHSRRAHLNLLHQWVGEPTGRWLKTDLYEERSSERALLGHLPSATWVGMDVSPATTGQARVASGVPVLAADIREVAIRTGALDGVLSTSTLDHFDDLADLRAGLAELHRILRPGGVLVLTLDNPRNPLIRARNALPAAVARRTGLVPFAVGQTLDARDGERALAGAGFTVERVAHLLHAPHVLGTRPARWSWWERRVLPATDRLAGTRLAPFTGHFVAWLARRA